MPLFGPLAEYRSSKLPVAGHIQEIVAGAAADVARRDGAIDFTDSVFFLSAATAPVAPCFNGTDAGFCSTGCNFSTPAGG